MAPRKLGLPNADGKLDNLVHAATSRRDFINRVPILALGGLALTTGGAAMAHSFPRGQGSSSAQGLPPGHPPIGPTPESSFAEQARALMTAGRVGSLSTLSRKQPGFPYGSLMPYALDSAGRPIFLISSLAMHTQNLRANPHASLFVTEETSADPLAGSRVTVLGDALPVPDADNSAVRALYLSRYPDAKSWVDFQDFAFYRMDVVDVYYIGGFGVMGWIAAPDYSTGQPTPGQPAQRPDPKPDTKTDPKVKSDAPSSKI